MDLADVDPGCQAAKYANVAAEQVRGGVTDVVVAHSGAGLFMPAIVSALSARAQLYVAALVPDGFRRFLDELAQDSSAVVHDDWVGVDPTIDHAAAHHFLFHDCDVGVGDWALTTLRRFVPTAVYGEVVQPVDVPATVVVPSADRTLRPSWMFAAGRDRPGVEPIVLDAGHCLHVSRPDDLAHIVDTVAARV